MRATHPTAPGASMAGKTVVMTGATSGLGEVAAEELAGRGARIVLVARSAERAEATLRRLKRRNPEAPHTSHLADLSLISETKRVAATIAAAEPRVDVLVNNAGAMFGHRLVTAEGLERTFATNHMAYVLLTLGLQAPLAAAGDARVVNTASTAHRGASYDASDIQVLDRFNPYRAYGRSKLYNILFTRELARRWAPLGIEVNCHHPGVVATRFGDETAGWMNPVIKVVKLFAITPEKGARTLIYLASAPEVAGTTGRYFDRCRAIAPTAQGQDDAAAAALWRESLRLAGLPEDITAPAAG